MKLKLYFIPLAFAVAAMLFAGAAHLSFHDIGDGINGYYYDSAGSLDSVLKEANSASPQDIIKQADIVVKARYSGNYEVTGLGVYYQLNVTDVFHGDSSLKGNCITMIQDADVMPDQKYIAPNDWLSTPLQKGKEYILLLKHKEFDPDRILTASQKQQYYPVTNSILGCYLFTDSQQTEVINATHSRNNSSILVQNIRGKEIFATSKKDLNKYYQYKSQIFKQLGVK